MVKASSVSSVIMDNSLRLLNIIILRRKQPIKYRMDGNGFSVLAKKKRYAERIGKAYLDNTRFGQLFRYNDIQIAA